MKSWNDITLKQYQEIDKINQRRDIDELDKVFFTVCVLNGMTEQQLDQSGVKVVDKLCREVNKVLSVQFNPTAADKIGAYHIDYNCDHLRAGQYVELQFFLHHGDNLHNCHSILASVAHDEGKRNVSENHKVRADHFLNQPVSVCVGSMRKFIASFADFNGEFKSLFGLDESVVGPNAMINSFNKRYGWTCALSRVAEYRRITLDASEEASARQFLNDLTYLKALDKYRDELNKQH
jgi:hypothetical protein